MSGAPSEIGAVDPNSKEAKIERLSELWEYCKKPVKPATIEMKPVYDGLRELLHAVESGECTAEELGTTVDAIKAKLKKVSRLRYDYNVKIVRGHIAAGELTSTSLRSLSKIMIDAELTLADTKFTPAQLEAIRITAQQSHMGLGVATSVESVLREGGGSTEQIHSICCAECDPGFIQIFGAANRSE